MTCWLGWTWSRKLAERQQGRDFIMNKMQTVLLIMYQSRIIIRLLTPKGLLKRLLKLCIKDIKRVLRRLLLLTVFIPWKAQCVCLCDCPSALVSMPAKLDHTILSFNSTGIFSNCFIGCWLKKKKRRIVLLCLALAWMHWLLLEKHDRPSVAEDVGQVQREP